MRVLLLNYEFPPAGGGAGFATLNIGRQLVKQGVDVHVLTARIESEVDGDVLDGMRVFRVTSWRKGVHDCGLVGAWSWVAFALRKRMQLHKQFKYDVEHYFFGLPTGFLSLTRFGGNRVPYLVSLRGSDVPGYDPFNHRLEQIHTLLRPITRRIWRRAGRVVALSSDLRSIAQRTTPEMKMDVIPNGIESSSFSPRESSDEATHGDAPMTIVTVSRLLERKGIHHLLEAVARPHPLNVRIVIAGTGSYESNLRELATELGLADRVDFRGFIRRDQLPEIYRLGDVFVLPSQTESFGLVFAEAMACGLPIIATRVGGIPDLVREGVDGLLNDAADVPALRASIEALAANAQQRREFGRSARERVVQDYSWGSVAARYRATYQECLNAVTDT